MDLTEIDDRVVDSEHSSAVIIEPLQEHHTQASKHSSHDIAVCEPVSRLLSEAQTEPEVFDVEPTSQAADVTVTETNIKTADETVNTTSSVIKPEDNAPAKTELEKSLLVSKVLQKAREDAAGAALGSIDLPVLKVVSNVTDIKAPLSRSSDQRSTGSTRSPDQRITSALAKMSDQRSTGSTRTSSQSTTGATRFTDQKTTNSTRLSNQSTTGATRFTDQKTTGATRISDQGTTGPTRISDQSTTGATRFSEQKTTGAVPRISDQRSTGATQAYVEQSTTGSVKSLIGPRAGDATGKTGDESRDDSDETTPQNSKKSLAATIQTEAKKSKVSMGLFEKIVSKHPILVGAGAFCIFVVPIYLVVINSQSASDRAEYKSAWGKDVKLIASKLRTPGELNGHKAGFYINRADAYIKSAEYLSAITDLKTARKLDLDKADDCNLKLSNCYLQTKDYKKASETSAEILKSDPSNIDALIAHGHSSYLLGNKLTALDDYFKAVKLDPSNPQVLIERGDYYVAEKKLSSAAADYKHALELAPGLAVAKQKLAACVLVAPRVATSAELVEASSKLSSASRKIIAEADFTTLRNKGYQALQNGDLNFAIAALTRAVSLNPDGALVRQYLAHALLAAGEYPDALTQFNAWDKIAVLKLSDKLAFARRMPADSCPTAAALYEQLIQQHPTDGQGLVSIARAAQAHGYSGPADVAIEAGMKVGTAPEKAQLTAMKVSVQKQVTVDVQSGKAKLAN